ncbi:OmpA family protein [Sphaerotilus hippei]|uniref:OmpA family protein n=1 Tax=Sphaerotilus hippei TaxID=744406 RepID=A0A318H8X6_9BURK|nr:OmpA family protein [Sphaerotilus hippei]PXW98568.1 OmpA family protein [Sphaerotilus hippei]
MSDDDRDDSRKVGLWVVFTTVAVLLIGVIGYAVMRTTGQSAAPTTGMAASAPAEAAADVLVDIVTTGEALATTFFPSGSADILPESATVLDAAVTALQADAAKKVLLSGYHDSTGDPAMNAELAKQRAKAVRTALVARGIAADRVLLRKPEVTDGGADAAAARRVEIRLIDAP